MWQSFMAKQQDSEVICKQDRILNIQEAKGKRNKGAKKAKTRARSAK